MEASKFQSVFYNAGNSHVFPKPRITRPKTTYSLRRRDEDEKRANHHLRGFGIYLGNYDFSLYSERLVLIESNTGLFDGKMEYTTSSNDFNF